MPSAPLPICDAYIRAGQELGIPYNPDFNGAQQAGVGFYQLTQRNRRRSSAAMAYIELVDRDPEAKGLDSGPVEVAEPAEAEAEAAKV